MAEDVFKPAGQLKAAKPDAGGAAVRNVPLFGIVKDNIDPNKAGRIFVYISDNSGKDPDSRDSWTPVSYLSPFFGRTTPNAPDTGYGKYVENPSSYGFWNSPPDIGTTVICFFVNGDMNYGFYIGAIPEAEALQMVPAIGAVENVVPNQEEASSYGGATRLPVSNINTNNSGVADSPLYLDEPKPVHSYSAAIYSKQGLIRDPIRGPVSSSANRESPSRVGWGIVTPGRPIYEGGYTDETIADAASSKANSVGLKVIARRGGHSIVLDDGDTIGRDQLVRIRSSTGHQILMSDDGQTLLVIHSNGLSYVELGKEGTVDVYATNSINLRTQGDLNLHADRNININAKKELKIKAENIKIESEKNTDQRVGEKFQLYALNNYTVKSDASISLNSKSDISVASSSVAYVNGSKVNLNTGATSTDPQSVEIIPIISHIDTAYDSTTGFTAAPGKLLSVTSRAPAHMPWANAGQGVDVQIDLTESASSSPSAVPAVAETNAVADTTPPTPVTATQTGTMPSTPPVSESIDQNSSGALIAAMAKEAAILTPATSPLEGYSSVLKNNVMTPVVGAFGQTPQMMQQGGFLKPGSAPLINSLVNAGKPIQNVFSNNMFTGKSGGETFKQYLNNVNAQAVGQVTNIQKTQTVFTKTGIITGKENASQIGGMLVSGITVGIKSTLDTFSNVGGGKSTGGNILSTQNNPVLKAVSTGNNALRVVNNVGSYGGLSKSIDALQKAGNTTSALYAGKGVTSAAFGAVSSTLKALTPFVPQNLKALSDVNKAFGSVAGALNTATTLNNLVNSTKSLIGGNGAQAAALASGILNMPGGMAGMTRMSNRQPGALPITLPGVGNLSGTLTNAIQSAFTGIGTPQIPSGPNGLLSSISGNLGGGQLAQLVTSITGLAGGGNQKIRPPSIGFNTVNISGLNNQVTGLLGDPRIPTPNNIGQVQPATVSKYETLQQQLDKNKQDIAQLNEFSKQIALAKKEYVNLRATLPAGDPAIEEAKQKWFALVENPERRAILDRL